VKGAAGLPALGVSSIDSASFSFTAWFTSCIPYGICSSFTDWLILWLRPLYLLQLYWLHQQHLLLYFVLSLQTCCNYWLHQQHLLLYFCTHVRSYSTAFTPCAVFCTASNVPSATPFAVSNPPPTTSVAPSATLYGFSYTFSGLRDPHL